MPASSLRVLVIGGGLGGLALAQGLHQADVNVTVFERDQSAAARSQGYRLHLDGRGQTALSDCLPPLLYDLFLETRGQPSRGITTFTISDGVLQATSSRQFDEVHSSTRPAPGAAVDRLTLRQILLAGLNHVVAWGKEFTRYERHPDGTIRACFADGTSAEGDVLVAADGVGSRVRRQFLPQAEVVDTGLRWLGGKTLLSEEVRKVLPPELDETFATVPLVDQSASMLFGLVTFQQDPNVAAAHRWPGLRFDQSGDYVFWGVLAPQARLGVADADLDGLASPDLLRLALAISAGWPAPLRTLIERCQPDRTFVARFRAAQPIQWPTSNVTLLGDAIHVMPPSGSGANLALADAGSLSRSLIAVARGEQLLLPALQSYEREMLSNGFAAVRASLEVTISDRS